MTRLAAFLGVLAVVGAWSACVGAEEAKTPISGAMLLHILAPAAESRDAAFDRAMKEPAPAPRRPEGEVQADGTVRYGALTMTVRNPCPPGSGHYEPPPLPGRARK
ncbi:MAG: hypothetical protein DME04_22570 [Candidatus Rokuibacteriota bacterium]|nr:MAG: hypothetical protein DME04_22570 [Candidatus Rokubacteria bacterium]